MQIEITRHANTRMSQRSLSIKDLAYILEHGQPVRQGGALFVYLRDCDLPDEDRSLKACSRLAGTAVVLSKDGERIITTWRNRRSGWKRIKRKSRYSLTPEQLGWAE